MNRHPTRAPARTRLAPSHAPLRGGWALVDVIVGGVILAIGLAAIIGLAERSLAMQQRAERETVAATLLDGLLNEVLVVGPVDWLIGRPTSGQCEEPNQEWEWTLTITKQGLGDPYRVLAVVTDRTGLEYQVDTLIAPRLTDAEDPARTPETPLDRRSRYDALR